MRRSSRFWSFPVGVALVFVGYFSVWLPNDAVGLAMIGLEIGEWVKFLPETRAGQVALSRVWFYAPPLTLAALIGLYSAEWEHRWRTWLVRILAALVATLALPAIPDMLDGGTGDLLRPALVLLVGILVLLASRIPYEINFWLSVLLAVVGGVVPLIAYLVYRPIIATYLTYTPEIGVGVWDNLIGHGLLLVAVLRSRAKRVA